MPHLAIQLTGAIEDARLPGALHDRLRDESRIRLVPRGVLANSLSHPIAALERVTVEDGHIWELRPLISKLDVVLGFEHEGMLGARLGAHRALCQIGDLQGIAGRSLVEIDGLELPLLDGPGTNVAAE